MSKTLIYAGAIIGGGALLYVLLKKRPGESLATAAGRQVADALGNVAVGGVKGTAEFFGVPDTNEAECRRDLADGNTWKASFSCPASTFISGVFSGTAIRAAAASDARQIDRIMAREEKAIQPMQFDLGTAYATEQTGAYDFLGNRIY